MDEFKFMGVRREFGSDAEVIQNLVIYGALKRIGRVCDEPRFAVSVLIQGIGEKKKNKEGNNGRGIIEASQGGF